MGAEQMREVKRDQAGQEEENVEYIFRSQLLPVPIPTDLLLHQYVLQHVDEYPDAVAIVDAVDGKQYTYSEGYGMTEHGCVTLSHCAPRHPRGIAKKGSVGFIVPNLEVKFLDLQTGKSVNCNNLGEICVRSKCVTKGYFKNQEATDNAIDAKGWLHTGDVGYIDEDGDVFLVDRIKELIKYKGFQVPPAELEAILISHPKIEEAVVVPLPDEIAGEVPVACVVIMQGSSLTEDDVMKFVASKVASYKKIRMVHFVDNIPRSAAGKILRHNVKETFLEHLQVAKIEIPPN